MHRDATLILSSADHDLELATTLRRGDVVGIGRDPHCVVVIPHATMARMHARLGMRGYAVTVEDAGSPSGTFVNDLLAPERTVIAEGDRLRLGAVELVVTHLGMGELMTPCEVREGYHGAVSRQTADGAPVDAAQFAVRSMNFGQGWRTPGVEDVRWTALLPPEFVLDVLDARLRDYVKDSLSYPDPNDPLEAALATRNWPTAAEVFAAFAAGLTPPALAELLLQTFAWDLVSEWFGAGPPEREPGFVINTVTATLGPGTQTRLEGMARRSGIPVEFQDV